MDQAPMQQPAAPSGQPNNPLANLPGGFNQKTLIYIVIGVVVLGGVGMGMRGMFSRNLAEDAIERATGGQVKYNDNTVTYKGNEGEVQVGTNATLPTDWPSDLPIMAGGTIGYSGISNPTSTSSPTTYKAGASVMFTIAKSVTDVAAYYNSELVKQGWTIEGNGNYGGNVVITGKKDTRSVAVSIVGSEGTATVTIGGLQQ